MSYSNRFSYLNKVFICFHFVIILIPSIIISQEITLTIGDAEGRLGDKLVPLDIRISTQTATIAGYNIWLQMDRPDLVQFQKGLVQRNDTTYWECNQYSGADCIDSTLVLEIHSWDFFHVDSSFETQLLYDASTYIMPTWWTGTRSLSAHYTDINIVSINLTGEPPYIIPPQNDELLIRLYLEVTDSLTNPFGFTDSVVHIIIQTEFRDYFSFIDPYGNTLGLGIVPLIYLDSTCYECLAWVGDICLSWERVHRVIGEPIDLSLCDSLYIVLDTTGVVDSNYFQINNGSFTLLPACGYTGDLFDISNLVALVDFMFTSGPAVTIAEADFDCDCTIDITDLVSFVEFMFNSGIAPGCQTQ